MRSRIVESIDTVALSVGAALTIGIMVSHEFRVAIGMAMELVIGWLPEILPFHMVLFVLAAITGLYASLIQKYTMN